MPKNKNPNKKSARSYNYNSIFFKLFAVLLGSVVITYLAFGGFYRSSWNASTRMEANKNIIHYSDLLAKEIGSPPDTNVALNMSRELDRTVGISGPGLQWRSPKFSQPVWDYFQQILEDTLHSHVGSLRSKNPSLSDGMPDSVNLLLQEGRFWTAIDRGGYVYIFGSRRRPFSEGLGRDWILLMAVLSLAWIMAWVILHRMLNPLKGLRNGVTAVESGDLDVRINVKGSDEFAELARSFNSMTSSLKERLQARDQLLLDVSHELRSPLTRMRVSLEMATPSAAVESTKEEVEDLEKMVSELLETERLHSSQGGLKLEPTNLTELVRKKAAKFENETPGLVLNCEEVPPLMLDPVRIRLVLRNLLDNAFKYGRNAPKPVEFSLRKEGQLAILEVRDYGLGIPEKDLSLIFEPFYRVDRARSRATGYGLGLGLCKRIVEMHGGRILLASRVGEGTRVVIELPIQ